MDNGVPSRKHSYTRNEYAFLSLLNLDQDVVNRLSIHLDRLEKGSNDIFVTPIAKDHGAENLLAEWDKVFQANLNRMNATLIKIEGEQKENFGPTSIAKPWEDRKEGVYQYYEDTDIDYERLDFTPDNPRDKGILRPLSLQNAAIFLKNDTNSGLPFFTRKSKVSQRVLDRFDYYLNRNDPCILFTRTAERGKTRNVWGYPIALTLFEMQYYRPVLDYQRKLPWRSALNGPDSVSARMTSLIKAAKSEKLTLVSEDFSRYDSTLKPQLHKKMTYYYNYLYQERERERLERMREMSRTVGLVTPDETLTGEHAESSGSGFTNEDGSITHKAAAKSSGCTVGDLYDFQSDDGALAVQSHNVDKLYENYRKLGLIVNPEKSDISDNYLIYLQCLFHIDYMKNGVIYGIYPVYRALCRILYQSRWSNFEDFGIQGKDYYSIRTLTLLENCKNHPLFSELVKFVHKYDKYSLTTTNRGISDYVRMIQETSGTQGILVNQYSDEITGIRNFESFKMVAELNKA